MWDEFKRKLVGKKVVWESDGEGGSGTVKEIEVTDKRIAFVIDDPKQPEPVILGGSREYAGIIPSDKDEMFITGGPAGWSVTIPK